jgi:hypothetical protein
MMYGIRLLLRAISYLQDCFERFVDYLYDMAYSWACGAYKVNWPLILYFGVFVPACLIITLFFVKGCHL